MYSNHKLGTVLPSKLRSLLFGSLGAAWPQTARLPKPLRLKTIFENLAVSDAEAFYHDLIWLRSDIREQLYSADFKASLNGFTPLEFVYPLYAESDATNPLARAQFTDINLFMTDDVLVKVDRMSMAHSLEVRSPLLDHRVLEYAAKLPVALKLNAKRGKLILRALAARRLPEEIRRKPKQGFSIPAAAWLRQELRGVAEEVIFDRQLQVADYLQESKIKQLWREHQSKSMDHSVLLWGLMMLGLWEKTHLATN